MSNNSLSDRLHLANLISSTTEEQVREIFKDCGEITDVTLRDKFGFISFANQEQAQRAMTEKQEAQLNGLPLRVSFAKPRGTGPGRRNTNRRPNFPQQRNHRAHPYNAPPPRMPVSYFQQGPPPMHSHASYAPPVNVAPASTVRIIYTENRMHPDALAIESAVLRETKFVTILAMIPSHALLRELDNDCRNGARFAIVIDRAEKANETVTLHVLDASTGQQGAHQRLRLPDAIMKMVSLTVPDVLPALPYSAAAPPPQYQSPYQQQQQAVPPQQHQYQQTAPPPPPPHSHATSNDQYQQASQSYNQYQTQPNSYAAASNPYADPPNYYQQHAQAVQTYQQQQQQQQDQQQYTQQYTQSSAPNAWYPH